MGPATSDAYLQTLEDMGADEAVIMAARGYAPVPPSWRKRWFGGSSKPWHGSARRCRVWESGPFYTDWQCLLPEDHFIVEGHDHIFEPELWPGGRRHEEWMTRSNPFLAKTVEDDKGWGFKVDGSVP